jgi:hypothetical protein
MAKKLTKWAKGDPTSIGVWESKGANKPDEIALYRYFDGNMYGYGAHTPEEAVRRYIREGAGCFDGEDLVYRGLSSPPASERGEA